MKRYVNILSMLLVAMATMAETQEWRPSVSWPFAYEKFTDANISVTTSAKPVRAKANIHVGDSRLWYESNGKRLQVKTEIVKEIVFANGQTYYNIEGKLCSVLGEDSINGKPCRLYMAETVNQSEYDEMMKIYRQNESNCLDIAPGLRDITSGMVNSDGARDIDNEALPMTSKFYILYNGELFEASDSNIMKHLSSKEERYAYRSYVRKAEVIFNDKTSMLSLWKAFFVK